MKQFRNNHPQRKYTGTPKTRYSDYRDDLRNDFNQRCGYTDCLDMWWGSGFQVDHFAPQKPKLNDPAKEALFLAKQHSYENLVYACPQVNRAKSNDWASDDPDIAIFEEKGYLHPCDVNFNDYFERTDLGGIVPKDNPVARYMWSKLRLYLKRYELYWRLDQIIEKLERLIILKDTVSLPDEIRTEALAGIAELVEEQLKYFRYLRVNHPTVVR